jgi:NADH-quinone oxidoreductase subunit L
MYGVFLLSDMALPVVAWVGTLTALLAATIGMAQFDIKRIMAYSTVSQLGYMFAGLGVLTSTGAVFHVVTHAFFKALLFLCCGAVMHGFGGQLDLRKLSGVGSMPGWRVVSIGMLIGCLNLAGFPFITAGFYSKDMILAEAFTTPGMMMIGLILLFTAGLTAYYTFRVYFRVFIGPMSYEMGEESHAHADHAHDDHGHDAHGHDAHGHDAHGHDAHGHDAHGKHDHEHDSHAHAHGDSHADHGHGHQPHPPGWAINGVLGTLSVLSVLAVLLAFIGGPYGAVPALVQQSSATFKSPFVHGHGEGHGKAEGTGQADGAHADDHGSHALSATPLFLARHTDAHAGSILGMDGHTGAMVLSSIAGLTGIGIAFLLHFQGRTTAQTARADGLLPAMGPLARWAQNKWYVDEFYDVLIRKPLWVLSHVFHLIDQFLVDGLVDLIGRIPRTIGKTLRPSQSGELHGYAVGMAGGIAILILIVLFVAT